ncbi:MCE family protein [bacterium]|nr:MCE family protein [bacterium]
MAEKRIEVTVGVVVMVALFIFILGIIWGKDIDIFSRRRTLVVRFDNVYGLERSDPVLVRGIKQGEVDRIVLKPEHVEVHLWIRQNVNLSDDLTVTIENRELIGGKQIAVDPGKSGRPVDFNHIYTGKMSGDLGILLSKTADVLDCVDYVLDELKVMLEEDHFEKVLFNIEEATNQLKGLVAENRQGLKASVQRVEQITQDFQKDSTLQHIRNVVMQLDSTVFLIKKVAVQIENEEGMFGKLLHDGQLYDQLLETSAHLDSLITEIKANPKRFVHFSLF